MSSTLNGPRSQRRSDEGGCEACAGRMMNSCGVIQRKQISEEVPPILGSG